MVLGLVVQSLAKGAVEQTQAGHVEHTQGVGVVELVAKGAVVLVVVGLGVLLLLLLLKLLLVVRCAVEITGAGVGVVNDTPNPQTRMHIEQLCVSRLPVHVSSQLLSLQDIQKPLAQKTSRPATTATGMLER